MLTKSNRTEIQTCNVEERTFGTPCIVYNFNIFYLLVLELTACYSIVYFRSIKPEPHPDGSFFRGLNLNLVVSIPILFMGESPPTPTPRLLKLFSLFYRPTILLNIFWNDSKYCETGSIFMMVGCLWVP